MPNTIPTGITLLNAITQQLDPIYQVFQLNSRHYIALRESLHSTEPLEENPIFLSSAKLITYSQILLLLAIAMHKGLFPPDIHHVTIKTDRCRIQWQNKITDQFQFGFCDESYLKCVKTCRSILLPNQIAEKSLTPKLFAHLHKELLNQADLLRLTEKKLTRCLEDKTSLLALIQDKENRDLLFIIISALPKETLNALFLFLNQFLPEDLNLTVNFKTFNIPQLFSTPTQDSLALMQKTIVYFDLYFSVRIPIIQEITKLKTTEFLRESLRNTQTIEDVHNHIQELITHQIGTRLKLLNFFIKHLNQLLLK